MKKRFYTPILLILSALCILLICSCSVGSCILDSCYKSCMEANNKPPTVEGIRKNAKYWDIELPEDLTVTYYAYEIGPRGDGCYFVELYYDGNDEEFNSTLQIEKDENFEKILIGIMKGSITEYMNNLPDDYELPTFEKNYMWLLKQEEETHQTNSGEPDIWILGQMLILYIPEENKLFVARFAL